MSSANLSERSLSPELDLVDIRDGLVWSANGDVSVVYRVTAYHEPAMDDEGFNAAAFMAENAWSGLPEGTRYQFHVLVDHRRALDRLEQTLPAIPDAGPTNRLFEEFRRARLSELRRRDAGTVGGLIQERRHYLVATFRPSIIASGPLAAVRSFVRQTRALLTGHGFTGAKYREAYEQVLREAETFDRRVFRGLCTQQGLEFRRCDDREITAFVYELLNPSTSEVQAVESLSCRARVERDGLPKSVLEEAPFAADSSPVWSLLYDDLTVRREHLGLGDRFVSVLSLKELPDRTEPGMLVPLLKLGREKYRIVYTVDLPRRGLELAALRAKVRNADGLRQATLVESNRKDAHAEAVGDQANEALRRLIASSQRIFGVGLHLVLAERSPEELDEAIQETLGVMSSAHGLRGTRETFALKPVFLSLLPGARPHVERRRKALTPVMVDLLPVWDFRVGEGKVVFASPNNSVVLYDPFDARAQHNANVLITGTAGAGKSVAAQMVVSGYELYAAAQGEPAPYVFIIDNGASYKRYMDLRDDARYVEFSFEEPPGVDVFAFEAEDNRNEHVSRLEWLLLDLLRVDQSAEEEFEKKKAALEQALYALYPETGEPLFERSFRGFAEALQETTRGRELAEGLFPFISGKFARLLSPNPRLALSEDVRAVCYDFKRLGEHKDLALIALRLVIYQVRRFSARMNRRRHRSFLVLDESWALLDANTGGSAVTSMAAPFIAASVRMGRKEGLSTIGLSQQIEDFATSGYGAAIVGNSATKLVGRPGKEGIEGVRKHLQLTERQVEQVRRLVCNDRFHEFLLIQGDVTNVVRVMLDPFSRWVFTTSPKDKDRHAALESSRPDLSLLERVRLLAKEG